MSLKSNDWLKLLGGAALLATGVGAAGIGPLAGLFGTAAAGTGATTAAGAGAAASGAGMGAGVLTPAAAEASAAIGAKAAGAAGAKGLGSLLAPSLTSQGIAMGASGAMGTPEVETTSYGQLPQMNTPSDPWAMFAQLMKQSKGGMS